MADKVELSAAVFSFDSWTMGDGMYISLPPLVFCNPKTQDNFTHSMPLQLTLYKEVK